MQASLAIIGAVLGLVAYFGTSDWRWLAGAVVLLANWPYTLLVIASTNKRLTNEHAAGGARRETWRMLERWGTLHADRSTLGLIATLIFLWAQR